jgi:DNA-binding CsgD family transcriptional regulator
MASTQRASGIPLMDDVPWGSHLCVFYETTADLVDTAAAYFEAGLQHNELCAWLLPPRLSSREATELMRAQVDDLDGHVAAGRLQFIPEEESGQPFDRVHVERLWRGKLDQAVASGYEGLRGAGDSAMAERGEKGELMHYERDIAGLLNGNPALALCTYALSEARALDVFDVVRMHNLSVARRSGQWQFLETPELQRANATIRNLDDALAIMAMPFPGRELLTERERMVLAFLVKGASSKEAGRELGISPRTIDFHRANIIEKLGARNTADAIRRVLSGRGGIR